MKVTKTIDGAVFGTKNGKFIGQCTRSEKCSYMQSAKDTRKNRKTIYAQLNGHGNAHKKFPRRSKAQMIRDEGLMYWEVLS